MRAFIFILVVLFSVGVVASQPFIVNLQNNQGGCPENQRIVYLSHSEDAHLRSVTEGFNSAYPYVVCDSVTTGPQTSLVYLSSPSNAHAAFQEGGSYTVPVMVRANSCSLVQRNNVQPSDRVFLYVTSPTNSHVSGPGSTDQRFNLAVVCSQTPQFQCASNVDVGRISTMMQDFTRDYQVSTVDGINQQIVTTDAFFQKSLRVVFESGDSVLTLPMTGLSGTLVFYVRAGNHDSGLEMRINNGELRRVADYTLSEQFQINTWQKVVVPGVNDVQSISFSIGGDSIDTRSIIYNFDYFYVFNEDTKYCQQVANEDGSIDFQSISQISQAPSCNAYPGFTFTGTRCCGDNPTENYADTNRICLRGQDFPIHTMFDWVTVTFNSNQNFEYLCVGQECEFSLPPFKPNNGNISITSVSNNARAEFILQHPNWTTQFQNERLRITLDRSTYAGTSSGFYYCGDNTKGFDFVTPVDGEQCSSVGVYLCDGESFTRATNILDGFDIEDMSQLTFDTLPPTSGQVCCPSGFCSNGTHCFADASDRALSFFEVNDDAYKCVSGKFKVVQQKSSFDNRFTGYCALDSQCLVTTAADQQPNCVNSEEHFGAFVCDNGEWGNRAVQASQNLIRNAGNQYTLFCDNAVDFKTYNATQLSAILGGIQHDIFASDFNCHAGGILTGDNRACVSTICGLNRGNSGNDIRLAFIINHNASQTQIESIKNATCGSPTCSDNWNYDATYNILYYKQGSGVLTTVWNFFRNLFVSTPEPAIESIPFTSFYHAQRGSSDFITAYYQVFYDELNMRTSDAKIVYSPGTTSTNICEKISSIDCQVRENEVVQIQLDNKESWRRLTAILR